MTDTVAIVHPVVEQHAEEAAFLWILRDAAVHAPHYSLRDLAKLDGRVEAHLDGLRVAGDAGWELCLDGLRYREPGEVFAAGVLALESGDASRLETVLAVAEAAHEAARGFVSALGWVAPRQLQGTAKGFLLAEVPFLRRLGIAACAVHRVDPGPALDAAVMDSDPALRARALRAVGELARRDLREDLRSQRQDVDEGCRFWATWSAALLGDADAAGPLRMFVESGSSFAMRALEAALRAMEHQRAANWLRGLAQDRTRWRLVVVGTGIVGDPVYVPWLIQQMAVPELARVAGEAFAMISGIDLAYEDLDGERPAAFEGGPSEDPADEDVALDPDEDLPWPNAEAVERWWQANGGRFQPGTRHLLGRLITSESLDAVLRTGRQRQRAAAALELAFRQPNRPLFETRAPGFRQQRLLSAG